LVSEKSIEAGHRARMIKMRNAYKIYLKNLKGKYHLRDLNVDVSIILKLILNVCGLDLSDSGYGPMADSCEHGNEPSGSTED
jgi:hypothetical protein